LDSDLIYDDDVMLMMIVTMHDDADNYNGVDA